MTNATEKRLIRFISEHVIESGGGKLTIQELCNRAGISRQAFNRNYKHLTPYVKGNRSIEELTAGDAIDARGLLTKCQARLCKLQAEMGTNKKQQEREFELLKESYITSLMNGDITIKDSLETRKQLHKQALHIEKLILNNKKLETQLNNAASKLSDLSIDADVGNHPRNLTSINVDLSEAYRKFQRTADLEALEDEKEIVLDATLNKVNKLAKVGKTHIVLYIDRFLASFEKFVSTYVSPHQEPIVVVRLPLFSRTDIRFFAKKIIPTASIELWIPQSVNESTTKAQRAFSFREVPEVEKIAADKLSVPALIDGYDLICVFKVRQGD